MTVLTYPKLSEHYVYDTTGNIQIFVSANDDIMKQSAVWSIYYDMDRQEA